MPSINLAPGSQYVMAVRKRRRKILGTSFLIVLVLAGIWGMLFYYQQSLDQQRDDLQTRIRNIQLEIAKLSEDADRVVLFEQRLTSLDALLNQHIKWNAVLQDLERLLPPPTVLSRVAVDVQDARVSIEGSTSDVDYVAQTLASLVTSEGRPTVFDTAELDGVARSEQSEQGAEGVPGPVIVTYTFTADLTFDVSKVRATEE